MTERELADQFFRTGKFPESELVIGLVGPVGTDMGRVVEDVAEVLKRYGYETVQVRVSKVIENAFAVEPYDSNDEYQRISKLMDAGDKAREQGEMILALGVAAFIYGNRCETDETPWKPRKAYVVNSLKHPEEVKALRHIYGEGFVLVGVHSDPDFRQKYLEDVKRMTTTKAEQLMTRDAREEGRSSGQRTRDTFHLSDFFLYVDDSESRRRNGVDRILKLLFGDPYQTPTFDEFCMFMAFSAALRSADLSRQVGAVIGKDEEIIAMGANDCPRSGGGLYWPKVKEKDGGVADCQGGRDHMLGYDSNDQEKERIVNDIVQAIRDTDNPHVNLNEIRDILHDSPLDNITEYGRVVHAEMEALMFCARNNVSCRGTTLYCTTFPCHNCAKHIIAAGIARVVYVEPYPKSKALEFHPDSAFLGFKRAEPKSKMVAFEPFVGVGSRRFFDLFSMNQGRGYPLQRKDKATGKVLPICNRNAILRTAMLPWSYLQREELAAYQFGKQGRPSSDAKTETTEEI